MFVVEFPADSPGSWRGAVDGSHPDLAVLAATRAETLEPFRPELGALARRARFAFDFGGAAWPWPWPATTSPP